MNIKRLFALLIWIGVGSVMIAGCGSDDTDDTDNTNQTQNPDEPGDDACTEAGCMDDLTIWFVDGDGEDLPGFSGELVFDDREISFQCPGDGNDYECVGSGIQLIEAPDEIEVTVTSEDFETTTTVTPDYEEFHPNGPDCPPTCHIGEETVTVE